MASVTAQSTASPDRVFEVLSNGWYYSNWVVGTSHMRAVQTTWPQAGSKVFHASGIWPTVIRDETEVEECRTPHRLVLTARGRPFGEARVVLEISGDGPGSRITMTETPEAGPGKWLHSHATEALLARRNRESLARLCALAEGRTQPSE